MKDLGEQQNIPEILGFLGVFTIDLFFYDILGGVGGL